MLPVFGAGTDLTSARSATRHLSVNPTAAHLHTGSDHHPGGGGGTQMYCLFVFGRVVAAAAAACHMTPAAVLSVICGRLWIGGLYGSSLGVAQHPDETV